MIDFIHNFYCVLKPNGILFTSDFLTQSNFSLCFVTKRNPDQFQSNHLRKVSSFDKGSVLFDVLMIIKEFPPTEMNVIIKCLN